MEEAAASKLGVQNRAAELVQSCNELRGSRQADADSSKRAKH